MRPGSWPDSPQSPSGRTPQRGPAAAGGPSLLSAGALDPARLMRLHSVRPVRPRKGTADRAGLTAGDLRAGHRTRQRRARRDDPAGGDPAPDARRPARADRPDRPEGASSSCARVGPLARAVARGSPVRDHLRRFPRRLGAAGARRAPSPPRPVDAPHAGRRGGSVTLALILQLRRAVRADAVREPDGRHRWRAQPLSLDEIPVAPGAARQERAFCG